LKADWSLLTQPARLQRLAETFATQLKLQPVDPHQIVELKDLPDKEPAVEEQTGGEVASKEARTRS
jgi:hypothetical protein